MNAHKGNNNINTHTQRKKHAQKKTHKKYTQETNINTNTLKQIQKKPANEQKQQYDTQEHKQHKHTKEIT